MLALCIETSPLVDQQAPLSSANIDRVKHILRQHRPEYLRSGEIKTIKLSEKELNLVTAYLARRLNAVGAVLSIQPGLLALRSTWDISAFLPYEQQSASYLNIETLVGKRAGATGAKSLHVESLKLGQLSLPRTFVEALLPLAGKRLAAVAELQKAAKLIQAIDISAQEIALSYQWQADLVESLRERIISVEERQALAIYHQFLALEVERQGPGLRFTSLLEATFRFAHKRSQNAEPVVENKAAIIVLAAYANGGGLRTLIPEARDWPKPRRVKFRLKGRGDLAQHFISSAALAVAGGGPLSNAIGLRKEIDDANKGSGFSFKDLAADRAGSRLGEFAVASPTAASTLQQRLSRGQGDTQLMVDIKGLEENLNKAEFERRYGGPGDERYQQVVTMIDRRINQLALYRHD